MPPAAPPRQITRPSRITLFVSKSFRCVYFVLHLSGKICNCSVRAGQLKDVHAGVGPIDNIDKAAIVDFDVVGLNSHLAALPAAWAGHAAFVGLVRDRGNIIAHLLRPIRIPDIHGPNTRIKITDKYHSLVIDRGERLVAGMTLETPVAAS